MGICLNCQKLREEIRLAAELAGRNPEEIKLIALLALAIPTAVMLTTPALWWEVEPLKVFACWLLGIIGTAALLGAISVHDETEKQKVRRAREKEDGR